MKRHCFSKGNKYIIKSTVRQQKKAITNIKGIEAEESEIHQG
jgi:hypothetical protein